MTKPCACLTSIDRVACKRPREPGKLFCSFHLLASNRIIGEYITVSTDALAQMMARNRGQ